MENPTYIHKKRGSTYELLGIAELQHTANPERPLREGDGLAVYRSVTVNPKLWCRSVFEFFDGRFVPGQLKTVYRRDPEQSDRPELTAEMARRVHNDMIEISTGPRAMNGLTLDEVREARRVLRKLYKFEEK